MNQKSHGRGPNQRAPVGRPLAVQFTVFRAMVVTLVFQAAALGLSWFMRDGGNMFRMCCGAAAIYWLSATWILFVRRGKPAHGELMWLTIGFPILTIAIYAAAPMMQRLGWG